MSRSRRCSRSSSSIVIDVPETPPHQPRAHRRVIPATCTRHGGAKGFTNLMATKRDGTIELAPHVTGQGVLTLAEDEVTELFDALGEWSG
jgi:hypothetical protein